MATFSTQQYTALCAAIADSALSYSYNGKTITYRSMDEMLRAKIVMERDLGIGPAGATPRRRMGVFDRDAFDAG